MSVFGDFQRVWVQRFPDSALPAAWEEDVRANLAKHKQKVAILREELEKEEFYVEYLETLLSDVAKHKEASQSSKTAPPSGVDVNDADDKTSDSKQVGCRTFLHMFHTLLVWASLTTSHYFACMLYPRFLILKD